MALNRWRCSLVLLLTLAWASTAFAQIRSATITGTVTDPTKALVPGATVIVTNQDTNARSELVTNEAGLFTAPYLTAGTYSIEVSLPGSPTFRRTGIVVATAETVRVSVELAVSKVGETVDVSAEAPMLQTDRTSVSGAVGAEMIEALPEHHPESRWPTPTFRPARCRATRPATRRAPTRSASAWTGGAVFGGRHQRRPRLHQRHPARRPAGDGRRLQRSVGRAEHGRPAGGARHLQQLQRRVRTRTGRDLDEHEVRHERVSRPGRLHDAPRGARREQLLQQRPGDPEARVPRQRRRRFDRRSDHPRQAVLLLAATTGCATTRTRPSC